MDAEKIVNILDACAMLAFLNDEEGADVVEARLSDDEIVCYAHSINICEVFYDSIRVKDEVYAEKLLGDLIAAGIIIRNDFDTAFWKEVARLKAFHRASLADFCGVVLAKRLGGSFLTADHHEFDKIAQHNVCAVEFIR